MVLEINLGEGQEQHLREPPTLRGRVEEEEPQRRHLAAVRDLRRAVPSCLGIYLKTQSPLSKLSSQLWFSDSEPLLIISVGSPSSRFRWMVLYLSNWDS